MTELFTGLGINCFHQGAFVPCRPYSYNSNFFQVGGTGRRSHGPDDALYNKSRDLREKVARGNTVLFLNDLDAPGNTSYDNVVFALRKFTGGMGDEDEDQPDSNKTWMNYFLRPAESARSVVCTRKANGEAAHFSARWIRDRFVLFAGSKNVHLALRNREDAQKYRDSRFLVARNVAESVVDELAKMEPAKASLMLSFMHHTQVRSMKFYQQHPEI